MTSREGCRDFIINFGATPSKSLPFASLVVAGHFLLFSPAAKAVESDSETTAVSRANSTRTVWWSRNLLPTANYELLITVVTKDPFEAGSAGAKPGGRETWKITENSEKKAACTGSVPAGQAEKRYDPTFNGRFKAGTGGGAKSSDTWKVDGHYVVSRHIHEESGIDLTGNASAVTVVKSDDAATQTYPVNVPITGSTTTELLAALTTPDDPNASANFAYTPFIVFPTAPVRKEVKMTNQPDPDYHDNNGVKRTQYDLVKYDEPNSFLMPLWPVPVNGQPPAIAAAAQQAYQSFYNALLAHEDGHRTRFKAHLPEVLALMQAYNQSSFWAVVCYGPGEELRSSNRAFDLAKKQKDDALLALGKAVRKIREAADKEQVDYDAKTNHGRNQVAVGGVNTVLPGGIPLAP